MTATTDLRPVQRHVRLHVDDSFRFRTAYPSSIDGREFTATWGTATIEPTIEDDDVIVHLTSTHTATPGSKLLVLREVGGNVQWRLRVTVSRDGGDGASADEATFTVAADEITLLVTIGAAADDLVDELAAEEEARIAADTALDGRLDTIEAISLATDAELATAVATHEADTTNVHGIANTALLETTAGAQARVDNAVTDLKNGAPAGGDTLSELHVRLAILEALGSLATDAELATALATILGGVSVDADTLFELKALSDLRMTKAANLADVANPATALANIGGISPAAAALAFQALNAYLTTLAGLGGHAALAGALRVAALDAAYVALAGDQAVAGVKTFASSPVVPTPAPGDDSTKVASTAFVTATVNALAAVVSTDAELATALAGLAALYQGLDSDLTTLGQIAPANDDVIQRKAGVWVNRTLAQLIVDLALVSDTAYAAGWDGVAGVAPSKNAVYDKIEALTAAVVPIAKGYSGGQWYGPPGASSTTRTFVADLLRTLPYLVRQTKTFDRIRVEVTTAGTAGTLFRLGIWNHDGARGLEGTLVLDAGTVAGDSTGVKDIVISQQLPLGWCWLGAAAQSVGGAPALRALLNTSFPPSDVATTSSGVDMGASPSHTYTGVAGALANLNSVPTSSTTIPAILLRAT